MEDEVELDVPTFGGWPVDPQDDLPVTRDRIWVDGCFDFAHHGTAFGLRPARSHQLSALQVMLVQCYRRGD